VDHDHVLGPADAELTLVEYGSDSCGPCHAVHEVIEGLRNRFGERMRYVFRHLPMADSEDAIRAAELAEYAAAETTGVFWQVHEALMERGPAFSPGDFEQIARVEPAEPRGARDRVSGGAGASQRGRRERTTERCAGNSYILYQRPPLCGRPSLSPPLPGCRFL
jgi:thioredoxin family protein